jgi:anti-sigma B factor antagonist
MPEEGTPLSMTVDPDGVLVLEGELDAHSASSLAEQLHSDPGIGVLDLAAVSFIDSSGLRVIVEAHQAREHDRGLVLRSPSAAVQRLLEISGLSSHLDVSG